MTTIMRTMKSATLSIGIIALGVAAGGCRREIPYEHQPMKLSTPSQSESAVVYRGGRDPRTGLATLRQ